MAASIKVFVIDASAVVRQMVKQTLDTEPDMAVVGVAATPRFALERLRRLWPDVVVLALDRPDGESLAFLRQAMAENPVAVVACSTPAGRGTVATLQAMAAGAVTVIDMPPAGMKQFLREASPDLVAAVRTAAGRAGRRQEARRGGAAARPGPPPQELLVPAAADTVVAIGTSTGGTQALEAVLTSLPAGCPGIVVVQHMPERFTAMFAQRLDDLCQIEVREAVDGDEVRPGRALIAPGGRHMRLRRSGTRYQVEVADGPPVNRHKPSVDVLFRSVARVAGDNALGVIMTGMGDDGARGLKEMHDAGARTVAEDESSCVVFGMPKEAILLGGVDRVVPLSQIAQEILFFARDRQTA